MLTALALILSPVQAAPQVDAQPIFLPGGEHVAVHLDLVGGEVEVDAPAELPLSEDALSALEVVPTWLSPHLAQTLSHLDQGLQDELGRMILDVEPELVDEVGFGIASLAPKDLEVMDQYGSLDLLVEDARAIYAVDAWVEWARLVEEDDHTTVAYTFDLGDGPEEWVLPWSYYYWYVLDPKLDMELPLYMDPERFSVASPPSGVSWRQWFPGSGLDEGSYDYRTHWLEVEPETLHEPGALEASACLDGFDIDPLRVVVDGDCLVLAEVDQSRGTLLATTLDLEAAWWEGEEGLAVNATLYAHRRDTLDPGESTLIWVDPDFPDVGASFEAILREEGLDVGLADPLDELADLSGYTKLILPLGLGEERREAAMSTVEAYVSAGGTALVQVEGSGDWPGFSSTEATVGELSFEGHPLLADVVAGRDSVWDGVRQDSLSGERPLGGDALDALGWWVSQNMFDNVSEYANTHDDMQRAVWPQRILHNHYGNCGELQDMLTAAGRATLLPVVNVHSMEDHVWNEVYLLDAWHPWQVDWSDGPTRIDYGGVGADSSFGGGKEVSSIKAWHANGRIDDDHVGLYTDTIEVEVSVVDAAGQPMDGAGVLAVSQSYYEDYLLDQAAWRHTDQQGRVTLHLGDARDYWVTAFTELGDAPWSIEDVQSGSMPTLFLQPEVGDPQILAADAIPDSVHQVELVLSQAAPPSLPEGEVQSTGAHGLTLDLDLDLTDTVLDVPPEHTYLGWMEDMGYAYGGRLVQPMSEPGTVDLMLLEPDQYQAYLAGEPFEALWVQEGVSSTGATVELDAAPEELVAVVSNAGSARHVHHAVISVEMEVGEVDEPEDPGGCGCGHSGGAGWIGLLGLVPLLIRRRRPRGHSRG